MSVPTAAIKSKSRTRLRSKQLNNFPRLHIPVILFIVLTTQIPFLANVFLSAHSWNLLLPYLGFKLVWVSNYWNLLTSAAFWQALGVTAFITIGTTILALIVGGLTAWLLSYDFPGSSVLSALFTIPFLTMPTVSALMWKDQMFNPSFGLVDWLVGRFGVHGVAWLSSAPKVVILIAGVWQWTPFAMLILLAGFQSIPVEVVDAAQVDGVNWRQRFMFIELPFMRRYIEVAALFLILFTMQTFGKIYILTQGGPGTESTNLPYMTYQSGFVTWEMGTAAALGVITVAISLIVINYLWKLLRFGISENTES
ncbi:sugar ABC transporter permease [Alicyclobacillus tolerans]|uniref:carbohydrate ABC transporter permease n=1 Tax=Alicyclobacillus tolerans TaxID=90970 RepID=UPI001F29A98B|nr:sugar ABC transporter permease [Alicyclobacillus tolerans]MCF8568004.1 sugar ABC transporter permease [Alicyclobacillus tolerans]